MINFGQCLLFKVQLFRELEIATAFVLLTTVGLLRSSETSNRMIVIDWIYDWFIQWLSSSVSIVTVLRAGLTMFYSRQGQGTSLRHGVHTGSGAHPASYPMAIRALSPGV